MRSTEVSRLLSHSLKDWLGEIDINARFLYLVGGTVRDLFLNSPPKDLDLVCKNAKELASLIALRKNAALVPMEKKPGEPCYRVVDREDSDLFLDIAEMRGDTIYDDLKQRDFTINAIAAEVKEGGFWGDMIDPLGGIGDIEGRIIRMAGDASLAADPVRVLRAVRFAAQLDFSIDEATVKELRSRAPLLGDVSAERITAELFATLKSRDSARWFRLMDELGILEVTFPEIRATKGCPQNGFHHKDVWEHSLLVMENTEAILNDLHGQFGETGGAVSQNISGDRLVLLKLTALLHDVGKPETKGLNPETGRITFYGHDEKGAGLLEAITERLKMSVRSRNFMVLLVSEHLRVLRLAPEGVKGSTVMKWFRKMGDDSIPSIILGMADVLSGLGPDSTEEYRKHHIDRSKKMVRDYHERIKARIESPGLVTGDDLIAFGLEPGPALRKILAAVRSAQDNGEINSRDEALALARELIHQWE